MVSKVWVLLGILMFTGMAAFMYVIIGDVISIPADVVGGTTKLTSDLGALLIRSQSLISESIQALKDNPDMSYYERVINNNRILGSVAFTFFWIVVLVSIGKFIYRKEQVSFWSWLKIIFVAALIVGVLQVIASWALTGDIVYPYRGVLDFILNIHVVVDSILTAAPYDIINVLGEI